jgi:hypothetical protein
MSGSLEVLWPGLNDLATVWLGRRMMRKELYFASKLIYLRTKRLEQLRLCPEMASLPSSLAPTAKLYILVPTTVGRQFNSLTDIAMLAWLGIPAVSPNNSFKPTPLRGAA